jgi:farnesyl-diphosphate farnesyltransferase
MTRGQDSTNVAPDIAYCRYIVEDVSRTFSLTIDLLDQPLADQVCVGYLLCRVADTIEDTTHVPPAEQASLLRSYGNALNPKTGTDIHDFQNEVETWVPDEAIMQENRMPDWEVVTNAPTVIATFESFDSQTRHAMLRPVQEMVDGMATFVERYDDSDGIRIQTEVELHRYCHYVAGTVGTLITNLLTQHTLPKEQKRTLETTAEHFGRLLQLVNIAKDVYDDYVFENNVYLPAEWLDAEGVSQDALLVEENRQSVAHVVDRVVNRAKCYCSDARAYIDAMPLQNGNTIAAWAIPYLLAVGTLRELESNPEAAVLDQPVKVSREEVSAIVDIVVNNGREVIPRLEQQIVQSPYHRTVPGEGPHL